MSLLKKLANMIGVDVTAEGDIRNEGLREARKTLNAGYCAHNSEEDGLDQVPSGTHEDPVAYDVEYVGSPSPIEIDHNTNGLVVDTAVARFIPEYRASDLVRRKIFSDIGSDLKRRYAKYLNENPDVLTHFATFAYEAKDSGRDRYSAKAIMERVRWEADIITQDDEGFHINNSYTSLLARTLVTLKPEDFEGFFEIRGKR